MLLPATIGIIAISWGLKSVLVPVNPSTDLSQSTPQNQPLTQPLPINKDLGHVDRSSTTSIKTNNATVEQIAKQVTVRVLTKSASGSGVIVAHQGQTYTVLTCQHVVAESKQGDYQILVVDGKSAASLAITTACNASPSWAARGNS